MPLLRLRLQRRSAPSLSPPSVVDAPLAALDNPLDLLLLLVFAVLIFGKQLPDVARSLGRGIRELRESVNFDEVADAFDSVNEVRSAVSPSGIVRAAIPGFGETQPTIAADADSGAAEASTPDAARDSSEARPEPGLDV